ncbi:transcriptional regulator, BadM/Rrf2 family [Cyclonatronum proteinivorum]|uniref:Transcriptional regulator, BadM/Rrf2 family n=1 Tax=Cyclonatronum proteinivorum TaxID=1457365 RepID=A0A345UNX4_9BACT|nr:Rrf2 family transcriptional regulator [Cyclonatronum proteinivorum]AXJ02176.1 transcriptional regulator, BadM/Rrf2 family [Cyclonatronum proteinivorum]
MQFLSLGTQYTLTALIFLSRQEQGTAVSASKLAEPLNSPSTYLSQMLTRLIEPGIIGTRRGIHGGVYLAKEAAEISIYDIVTAVEGDDFFKTCFLGISGCGDVEPCPFHEEWGKKRGDIEEWLRATSLDDLANDLSNHLSNGLFQFERKAQV